jgi:hypothetical protein
VLIALVLTVVLFISFIRTAMRDKLAKLLRQTKIADYMCKLHAVATVSGVGLWLAWAAL